MPPVSLGHVDVLGHNQDVYGPSYVAHLLTTTPYRNLLPYSMFNTPQNYIHGEGRELEGNREGEQPYK